MLSFLPKSFISYPLLCNKLGYQVPESSEENSLVFCSYREKVTFFPLFFFCLTFMFRGIILPTSQKGEWGTKISSTRLTHTTGHLPRGTLLSPNTWFICGSEGIPGLKPARLLCPWNFPGKNTGVVCHFILQRDW